MQAASKTSSSHTPSFIETTLLLKWNKTKKREPPAGDSLHLSISSSDNYFFTYSATFSAGIISSWKM